MKKKIHVSKYKTEVVISVMNSDRIQHTVQQLIYNIIVTNFTLTADTQMVSVSCNNNDNYNEYAVTVNNNFIVKHKCTIYNN